MVTHFILASLFLDSREIVSSYAVRGAVTHTRHISVQHPLAPLTRAWPSTSMVIGHCTTGLLVLVFDDMIDTSTLSVVTSISILPILHFV